MKDYIEERAIGIAGYIIEHNATVRQTAEGLRHQQKHGTYGCIKTDSSVVVEIE